MLLCCLGRRFVGRDTHGIAFIIGSRRALVDVHGFREANGQCGPMIRKISRCCECRCCRDRVAH